MTDRRIPQQLFPADRRYGGHDRHRHGHQAPGNGSLHAGGQVPDFFEQMKGRGVRVISDDDLKAVTPDAKAKDHFIIVDAVGVCERTRPIPGPGPEEIGLL